VDVTGEPLERGISCWRHMVEYPRSPARRVVITRHETRCRAAGVPDAVLFKARIPLAAADRRRRSRPRAAQAG